MVVTSQESPLRTALLTNPGMAFSICATYGTSSLVSARAGFVPVSISSISHSCNPGSVASLAAGADYGTASGTVVAVAAPCVDAVGTGAVETSEVGIGVLVASCGAAAAGSGTVEIGVGVLAPPPPRRRYHHNQEH
jgi:hypothetical protein